MKKNINLRVKEALTKKIQTEIKLTHRDSYNDSYYHDSYRDYSDSMYDDYSDSKYHDYQR